MRTDQRRGFQRLDCQDRFLRRLRLFRMLGEPCAGLRQVGGTITVGEDSEMPDLDEPRRQDVETKTAKKLLPL